MFLRLVVEEQRPQRLADKIGGIPYAVRDLKDSSIGQVQCSPELLVLIGRRMLKSAIEEERKIRALLPRILSSRGTLPPDRIADRVDSLSAREMGVHRQGRPARYAPHKGGGTNATGPNEEFVWAIGNALLNPFTHHMDRVRVDSLDLTLLDDPDVS